MMAPMRKVWAKLSKRAALRKSGSFFFFFICFLNLYGFLDFLFFFWANSWKIKDRITCDLIFKEIKNEKKKQNKTKTILWNNH